MFPFRSKSAADFLPLQHPLLELIPSVRTVSIRNRCEQCHILRPRQLLCEAVLHEELILCSVQIKLMRPGFVEVDVGRVRFPWDARTVYRITWFVGQIVRGPMKHCIVEED